jgi:hypothetical protein
LEPSEALMGRRVVAKICYRYFPSKWKHHTTLLQGTTPKRHELWLPLEAYYAYGLPEWETKSVQLLSVYLELAWLATQS